MLLAGSSFRSSTDVRLVAKPVHLRVVSSQPFGGICSTSFAGTCVAVRPGACGNFSHVFAGRFQCATDASHTPCGVRQLDVDRRKIMSSLDIQRWSNDFTALTKLISEGIEKFILQFLSS